MEPIVIQASRTKWMVFLAGALCFVAASLIMLLSRTAVLVGWVNLLIFGACALVFGFNVFDRRPRITIDERGILDRTLKVGMIEWADITDVQLKHSQGQPFLCLSLRDPAKYLVRLPAMLRRLVVLNRALGFTELSLNLVGANADAERVEELVRKELAYRSQRNAV